jgi:hypothetical protein
MLDTGGGSTKVVLKHPCVIRADSVRSITLLAVMTGAKDTYAAMKEAFGPLLLACSEWNRCLRSAVGCWMLPCSNGTMSFSDARAHSCRRTCIGERKHPLVSVCVQM